MLTPEQLADRKTGLGGTDGTAVVGVNPWKGPLQVYLEKTGQAEEQEENLAMRVGTQLEPLVLELTREHFRREGNEPEIVYPVTGTLRFSDLPAIIGHPDAILTFKDGMKAILEIKTTFQRWEGDEIPLHYVVQALHYAGLVGASKVYVAVLLGNSEFHLAERDVDQDFLTLYYRRLQAWWDHHVVKRIPPDPVLGVDTAAVKRALPKEDKGTVVTLAEDMVPLVMEYDDLKRQVSQAQKRLEDLEKAIMWRVGSASKAVLPDGSGFGLSTISVPAKTIPAYTYRRLSRLKKVVF